MANEGTARETTRQIDRRLWLGGAAQPPASVAADAALCSRARQGAAEKRSREERLRIGVCIKQVPDTDSHLRIADSGREIDDSDLNWVISSCDLCALEEALLLAEAQVSRGEERPELVVFSLGPARVEEALRKALALGADRAVHLADEALQGGDALADGRALAAALAGENWRSRADRSAVGRPGPGGDSGGDCRDPGPSVRLAGHGGRAGRAQAVGARRPGTRGRHERGSEAGPAGRTGDSGRHQQAAVRFPAGNAPGPQEAPPPRGLLGCGCGPGGSRGRRDRNRIRHFACHLPAPAAW